MFLTLEGQNKAFNLNAAHSIRVENTSLVIKHLDPDDDIEIDCRSREMATLLYEQILNQISQHQAVFEVDRVMNLRRI